MAARLARQQSIRFKQNSSDSDDSVRLYWHLSGYVIGLAVLLGSLAYAYAQITRDDVLPITELRLVGEFDRVELNVLKELVTQKMDGNFFTVDVANIHQTVTDLPWVDFAWVDRVWPQTLQVRVVEEKPVAYLEGVGLLNKNGDVFTSEMALAPGQVLPKLSGSLEDRQVLIEKYNEFAKYFQLYDLSITLLDLDQRGSLKMRLSNGVELVLGREDVARRLNRFLKIFGQKMAQGESSFKHVDLRYANGFALSEVKQQLDTVVS